MRHHRHWVAWLALLGFVLAQGVTAAYACAAGSSALQQSAREKSAPQLAMSALCDGMAGDTDANPNLCQAHCKADHQVDSQCASPLPAIAPPLALTISVPEPRLPDSAGSSRFRALGAAPPPSILFGRLQN